MRDSVSFPLRHASSSEELVNFVELEESGLDSKEGQATPGALRVKDVGNSRKEFSRPMLSVMIVAAITVHWKHGFFAAANGIELPLLYAAVAVVLALTGPVCSRLTRFSGWSRCGRRHLRVSRPRPFAFDERLWKS